MKSRSQWILGLTVLLSAVAVFNGCKDDSPTTPTGDPTFMEVPDFSLTDVNSSSSTYDTEISPRDYLQSVSAWYFGHST